MVTDWARIAVRLCRWSAELQQLLTSGSAPPAHLPLVQGGADPVQALPATFFRDASGNTWSRVNGASGMSAGAAGSIHIIASISAFGAISPVTSISYSAARTRKPGSLAEIASNLPRDRIESWTR